MTDYSREFCQATILWILEQLRYCVLSCTMTEVASPASVMVSALVYGKMYRIGIRVFLNSEVNLTLSFQQPLIFNPQLREFFTGFVSEVINDKLNLIRLCFQILLSK